MKVVAVLIFALIAQSYAYSSSYDFEDQRNQREFDNIEPWTKMNRYSSSNSEDYEFKSSASRFPEAQFFKRKVIQRLSNSPAFYNNPQNKQRLIEVADEKLENCKTPSGNGLDRSCLGRAIGQVMQLVASVENADRNSGFRGQRQSSYDY
ncbi:uncharacterized protein LOC106085899 [Stomoxys calcitrans]|uniref:uncharacterized protein LOC106085899 n=1 Tax=Stomoxys calcitrans TaxID=35570 RepID=UPI0027E2E2A3|nr:uncharacterized protein LOC106085899 [Stomoxys calcitrans]